ncbi:hypothetical protein [Blautia sp. MSJ-19]|uniref:hypothetical protein n=1 Tax=Blautia sp. MSJ-19 TaxID=2841517 RepID=UPI001C0EEF7D|nr:hypothetical protein [Blautia sp. MSJ-19]MBU5479844.1 hypothetical protein [Blautia sp. MSJ-19]
MKKKRKNRSCLRMSGLLLGIVATVSFCSGSVLAEEHVQPGEAIMEQTTEEVREPVQESTEKAEGAAQESTESSVPQQPENKAAPTEEKKEPEVPEPTETPVEPTQIPEPTKAPEPVEEVQKVPEQPEMTAVPLETKAVTENSADVTESAEKEKSAQIISVDITWGDLDFIYKKGLWNPETHEYVSGDWQPGSEGSNQIIITNQGTETVQASLNYIPSDTQYSGHFCDSSGAGTSSVAVAAGNHASVCFMLSGTPSEELNNQLLGTVTVTIGGQGS